jgi:sugar porter (SP) family MFS transporter
MMTEQKTNKFIFFIAGLVSIGGILYGYDVGVISGALLFVRNSIQLTDAQLSLIGGGMFWGGLAGTFIAGPLADRFGRRFIVIVSSLAVISGVSLILIAHTFVELFIARLLLGTGIGIVSVGVPLYVAEIVPSHARGKYVTFFQLLLTFGIVLAYFVDLFFTPSGNWRAMFAVLLVPALILFLGAFFLPETPRWLLANHQEKKARDILLKMNNEDEASLEANIQSIQAGLDESHVSWREFFSYRFLLPATVAILVAIFNQLTGINSFLQYAPLILKNAGISSNVVSMIGSTGIGALNFIFTIVAIVFIDTLGRRPLLLVGVGGVMVTEIYLGVVNYFLSSSPASGILSLIGLLSFIIFFAIGPGVVVWLAISELFPTRIRGKGISICLFFSSLSSAMLTTFFLPLVKFLGIGQTYWLFAFFTGCYFLLTYFFLPETKAKTLEEIQDAFFDKKKQNKQSGIQQRVSLFVK